MAIANRGVSSTEKKLSILCLIIISRDNFLIDLTDLVTGRSFKFVFQQRCFFINSSSLEFYVFQLEFRGINYCFFFYSSFFFNSVACKGVLFFFSDGVKQEKSKQAGHFPTLWYRTFSVLNVVFLLRSFLKCSSILYILRCNKNLFEPNLHE